MEVKFREESVNYHDGQHDLVIYALINGIVHGYIEYSLFQNEIYINMIEVTEENKRKGIATKMMHYLRLKNSGIRIRPGYSTEEGGKFWNNYSKQYLKKKK